MTYQHIEMSQDGLVASLALNRPTVMNALSPEMVSEMRDAIANLAGSGARALLLTGRGRGFCAGADLGSSDIFSSENGEGYGKSVAAALDTLFNPLIRELYALDVPIVCAVNGVAAGGGVGLALVADICIAARSASFIQVFGPKLGLVPDAGASWLMARLLGRGRALGAAMLGERISAEQAEAWGLIWRCVENEALRTEAMALATQLAEGPTRAFPRIRRVTDAAMLQDLSAQLSLERDHQRELCDSYDTLEGVAAFREKRSPLFKGR